jgi:uncharacterized protein (TIGR00730 family)
MAKKKATAVRSFENLEFLNSSDGRVVRILSEYLEPRARFAKYHIVDTVSFFGSARIKSKVQAAKEYNKLKSADPKKIRDFAKRLRKAQHTLMMSKYYEDAVELSKMLTKWSIELDFSANRFIICTGGGPGIMEAANRGAKLAGGYSIGLSITLPFEEQMNKYVTPQLAFEFHYFFMRKFWFAYLSKALIAFPGGFGTADELFEILTLVQTQKIKKKLLIIMYDKKYWEKMINWEAYVENGMVGADELKILKFADSIDEVFKMITEHFEEHYIKD